MLRREGETFFFGTAIDLLDESYCGDCGYLAKFPGDGNNDRAGPAARSHHASGRGAIIPSGLVAPSATARQSGDLRHLTARPFRWLLQGYAGRAAAPARIPG